MRKHVSLALVLVFSVLCVRLSAEVAAGRLIAKSFERHAVGLSEGGTTRHLDSDSIYKKRLTRLKETEFLFFVPLNFELLKDQLFFESPAFTLPVFRPVSQGLRAPPSFA